MPQRQYQIFELPAWQNYQVREDEQVFEWTRPLSELKKENKKQYDFLTREQMCEQPLKFFTSAIRTLETEVKGSEFSLTLGVYIDGAIQTAIIAPEQSYKFCQYVNAIDPKDEEGRAKPCFNDLVKMTTKQRDKYLLEHVGKYDVPLTLMLNRNSEVGGIGSGIAHGIFSMEIVEEIEKIIYSQFTPEELNVSYKFLGFKDGLRVTYTLAQSVVLPDPIGEVSGYFTFITRNDFHTALSGQIGLIRDRCLNGLLVGGAGGGDSSAFYSDAGKRITRKNSQFWISHKTPLAEATEQLKEVLPEMVKVLAFAPKMLEATLTENITLKEAELFLESIRRMPIKDGLDTYKTLWASIEARTKDRETRGQSLTLYDLIEKLTEVASDNSPFSKVRQWDRYVAEIRFKAGQALNREMFESELEAMKDLQDSRKKAEKDASKRAEEKRKERDTRDEIMRDLKIKTVREFKESKERWDKQQFTPEELEYFLARDAKTKPKSKRKQKKQIEAVELPLEDEQPKEEIPITEVADQ